MVIICLFTAKKDLELKHKADKDEERCRIEAACAEKHKSALQDALAEAEESWQEKLQLVTKQKVQEAIKECNQKWLSGDTDTRQLVEQRIVEERTKWLTETTDWDELKKTWMDKEGKGLIQREIRQAREELGHKHKRDIEALERQFAELDSQRRNSVKEEYERMEEEYKKFVKEHEVTMTNAIQAAKAECEKDKVICQSFQFTRVGQKVLPPSL